MRLWIKTEKQIIETENFNAVLLEEKDVKLIMRSVMMPTSLSDRRKQLEEKEICVIHCEDLDDSYDVFTNIGYLLESWTDDVDYLDLTGYSNIALDIKYYE